MSNNVPDYENYNDNLVFPPKSADDLNKQERQSDVLISTIEKCERLEKQLEIAKKCLKEYAVFKCKDSWFAKVALEQIKELDK